MPTKMKPRQRRILQALIDLGGRATQKEIAQKTGLSVNGVSQSLGAMQVQEHVVLVERTRKEATWAVKTREDKETACQPSS